MKELKVLLLLGPLLLLTLLGLLIVVPNVNATIGLVCLADGSATSASCPSSPASLSAPAGSNVTVAVNIQGSDSMNGFDIAVQVDPSVLQPLSIALSNSVMHEPRLVFAESANSTTGNARLAMAASYVLTGPVTGNLFDIIYRVLSSAAGTAIAFDLGCSGTSVPNACVTVVNLSTVDSETVQAAAFSATTTPDYILAASPSTLGPLNINTQSNSTITVTPSDGFTGTVTLTPTPSAGLTAVLSQPSVTGGMGTSVLTVKASAAGTYNVNITGTSGSLTHSVKVMVYVGADFTIASSKASLNINQGSSSTYTLTLQSVNGFSGSVSLMATVTSGGPTATLNPRTLTLSPGTTGQSTVRISTSSGNYSSTSASTYTVNVTGTSGSISHYTTVTITVTSAATPAMPSGTVNLPTSVIVGVVVAIAAAVVVTILAVRRAHPKK